MQDDLFSPWMPEWLEGETLYGLCSRYHRVAGHRLASVTCQRLFGHPRAGLNHDLPGRIDEFVRRTSGHLGTAEDLLLGRTVLAYYLRFRTESEGLAVLNRLRKVGPGSMKASLGWLATRIGAAHPLRACPSCVEDSIREYGTSTWVLLHQLPGVWYCPLHDQLLLAAQAKVNGLQRFQWLLPDDVRLDLAWPTGDKKVWDAAALGRMRLITEATIDLLAAPRGFTIDPLRLAGTCLSRLVDLRMASPNGRLQPQLIGRDFAAFLAGLASLPESEALCVGPDATLCSLRRLLQPGTRPLHPLRSILTALWLFGSWKEFMMAYLELPDLAPPVIGERTSVPCRNLARSTHAAEDVQSFLHLVRDKGISVRSAATRTGVDIQTGLNWATRAGLQVSRRPQKLRAAVRSKVITVLRGGASKQTAADLGHISVVTVNRILASEPGLQGAWRQACEARRRASTRSQLLQAIGKRPNAGIKEIRGLVPAAYVWLYRHDRPWLEDKTRALSRKIQGNHSFLDWNARDADFARQVKAMRRVMTTSPTYIGGARTMQLVRLVPGLQSKLRHLDRLPLTRAALITHS